MGWPSDNIITYLVEVESPRGNRAGFGAAQDTGLPHDKLNQPYRNGQHPDAAQNLRIRADLMGELRDFIRRERLTQAQAAELLGVSQLRVSDLVRGKIDLFTIDMLVNMLARAGRKVEVRTRRVKAA